MAELLANSSLLTEHHEQLEMESCFCSADKNKSTSAVHSSLVCSINSKATCWTFFTAHSLASALCCLMWTWSSTQCVWLYLLETAQMFIYDSSPSAGCHRWPSYCQHISLQKKTRFYFSLHNQIIQMSQYSNGNYLLGVRVGLSKMWGFLFLMVDLLLQAKICPNESLPSLKATSKNKRQAESKDFFIIFNQYTTRDYGTL